MKKIISVLLVAVFMLGILVACNNQNADGGSTGEVSPLEAAKSYLQTMYKDKSTTTAADFDRVGVVVVEGVKYTVTWTVNVTEGITITVSEDGKTVHFDVIEESSKEIPYVLTATISDADGKTVTLEFNYTIPKFAVNTWADYMAAKEGDNVVVEGIVVAINSKAAGNTRNHLFIMDESGCGGYYSYQMEADPVADLGIAVGMTVRVTGPVTPYNGMQEIKGGVATVLDTTVKEFSYVDITDKFTEGTDFNQFVSMPVVIKGVTIGGQELANASSQYLYFTLNGVQGYVRTYVTDFPTNLTAEDKTTIDAMHAEKFGYVADVSGILITYSGTPYLIPTSVDCFTGFVLPERNDAEKVAFEKDNLSFAGTISKGGEMALPGAATYSEVTVTWTSDNELVVVNGDKINVTIPTETTTVKLTATLTCGDATETKEFEVKILAGSMTYEQIVDAAYGLATGEALEGNYRLFGVITAVNTAWSDQYNNITVTIQIGDKADKQIECYRLKGDGAQDLKVGDAITVEGVLKNYNGKIEFDAGCVLVGMGEVISQQAILDIAYGVEQGVVTEESYTLTGVISSVDTAWSEQYQNITVTIIVEGNTEKPMKCYRLKGDGAQNLKVGDTITVTGNFTNYNGTIEFNAGCTLDKLVPGEGGSEEGGNTEAPAVDVTTNAGVEIKEGVAYLMSMNQVTNGHTVYVCGGIDQDRFLVTSTDKAAALKVYVEKSGAGYMFYTTIDGAKMYINITTNEAGKTAVLYQATGTTVYTYDSTTNVWKDNNNKYLGSYQAFDTVSASNTSYINAENTGVSQFPLELVVAD